MWNWGAEEEEEEDEEIVVLGPNKQPGWLRQLKPEEKERLYRAIGYDANENVKNDPEVRKIMMIIFEIGKFEKANV